ncbi:shadow of prion protein [Ahaetulla prasina]|uniref:shadow of prion protein n=1 Tax=Ahaetulla prasina TaxID=499056 RepID=UPI00264A3A33|nr:shadow of prion protein [Ahaetulla prasina]
MGPIPSMCPSSENAMGGGDSGRGQSLLPTLQLPPPGEPLRLLPSSPGWRLAGNVGGFLISPSPVGSDAWGAAPTSRMPRGAPNPSPTREGRGQDEPPPLGRPPPLQGRWGGRRCLPGVRPCPPSHPPGGAGEARSDEEPEPRRRAERGAVGAAAASACGRRFWSPGRTSELGAARISGRQSPERPLYPWVGPFLETMRVTCSPTMCWTLLFLLAIFMEGIVCKGGRGGARGSARGSARGTSRRSKSAPRYRSSGTALRVAAAAAAGGAAAAAAAAGMSMGGPDSPQYGEMQPSNNTAGSTHHPGPWPLLYVSASLWCVALVPRAL